MAVEVDRPVLFGRDPNAGALAEMGMHATLPEVVRVPGPSVSSNHVAVWVEQGVCVVKDLKSRNGTWLLLPREEPVSFRTEEIVLQLARGPLSAPTNDDLPDPQWNGQADYGESLVHVLMSWRPLRELEVEVRIATERRDPRVAPNIPLANGQEIELISQATVTQDWPLVMESLWRWVHRWNATYEAEDQTRREGMILVSPAIRAAHRETVRAAKSDARILLLTGPTGAGKEMLAEVFHRHTGGAGPFIAVNCSMFNKDFLRAELFGAEAGSFTGATRRIIGAVERAQGGTLFLDEIGDIPEEIQPMLLRFLDRREIETLGRYGKSERADVRIVAATNKDLRRLVREGKFRADLWYRLSVHIVDVRPLAERWEDVAVYLQVTPNPGGNCSLRDLLAPSALEVLRAHRWDGNFRELRNFRERIEYGARPGSIHAAECLRTLERGALYAAPSAPPPEITGAQAKDLVEIAARATRAFREDYERDPSSWDDQKEWNEKYLKPLLFHHLSGASAHPSPPDEEALRALASRCASRAKADRGTALKQLARYYLRFR